MTERLESELKDKIASQVWKAKAEVWEQAYNKLLVRQYSNNISLTLDPSGTDETGIFPNQEETKKTAAENYEEGEKYAEQFLSIYNPEQQGEFQAENIFLAGALNWVREKATEAVIGFLVNLLKKNAVKAVNWLLEQSEDVIVKGFERLDEQDKILLKNEMKQYPRFKELLDKIEASE